MNQSISPHVSARKVEVTSQSLLIQVKKFLDRSTLSLTPQNRILDISSEFGEVFNTLSGNGDLGEEVGDLLYSGLALCCELGIENFAITPAKGIGLADLAISLGRLAKEELKVTNYGRERHTTISDGLRTSATDFAIKVIQFAIDKTVDPTTALAKVLTKYELRLGRNDSPGSGS